MSPFLLWSTHSIIETEIMYNNKYKITIIIIIKVYNNIKYNMYIHTYVALRKDNVYDQVTTINRTHSGHYLNICMYVYVPSDTITGLSS